MMSDVLRVPKVLDATQKFPALRAYVDRAVSRPAFKQVHADQMAHFAKADK
jgi:glutathione S-transferase